MEERFAPAPLPSLAELSALPNALMRLPGVVKQAVMKQAVVSASHFPASPLSLTSLAAE